MAKETDRTDMRDRWMDRISGGSGERDHRDHLTDTTARHEDELDEDDNGVGGVMGGETGEEDRDPVPGGWEGTDDATSTAPSDLSTTDLDKDAVERDPDEVMGRAYAGGIGNGGGVTDIKGSPVEESRDWENDPIVKVE